MYNFWFFCEYDLGNSLCDQYILIITVAKKQNDSFYDLPKDFLFYLFARAYLPRIEFLKNNPENGKLAGCWAFHSIMAMSQPQLISKSLVVKLDFQAQLLLGIILTNCWELVLTFIVEESRVKR